MLFLAMTCHFDNFLSNIAVKLEFLKNRISSYNNIVILVTCNPSVINKLDVICFNQPAAGIMLRQF